MQPGNVGAVFLFELRRAATVPRLAWWAVLALFPVFIVTLIRISPVATLAPQVWAFIFAALVPMLVTMLGTLLWTTPAVAAELERRSWVYLAVRPNGGTALVLGKYLAAVTWVLTAAFTGLTIGVAIAPSGDAWRIFGAVGRLVLLSCPAYAALYLLLGTLFPRRAMVIAVAYTLIFELVVPWMPALINKLTIQFRLRPLLLNWARIPIEDAQEFNITTLMGVNAPPWFHVLVLVSYTACLLVAVVVLIRWREFSTADEADT
jgi:ABC-type transport system involved in multi-copper enzyme maturation permease subunit